MWLAAIVSLGGLYGLRALLAEIPPQDHVALSLLLCALLIQMGTSLEQVTLRISLPENRCWVSHHWLGTRRQCSLPASQIHSACVEFESEDDSSDASNARMVLITSLGMIPVNEKYRENSILLDRACRQINEFLASQERYLFA